MPLVYAFLLVPLYSLISPAYLFFYNEIAGAHPNMNIEVAVYDITHLQDNKYVRFNRATYGN